MSYGVQWLWYPLHGLCSCVTAKMKKKKRFLVRIYFYLLMRINVQEYDLTYTVTGFANWAIGSTLAAWYSPLLNSKEKTGDFREKAKSLAESYKLDLHKTVHIKRMKQPQDPRKAVATPETNLTTFGSIRIKLKSPKSTFTRKSSVHLLRDVILHCHFVDIAR